MTFICLINLCGLPFSIGFYIKHLLVLGYNINSNFMYFIYTNIVLGAISGLFYSYRLFYNVFFDFKKSKKTLYNQSNRKILNSFYYSNTSLASNFSIMFLVIISYLISLYLFNIFLSSSSLGEGLNIYSINSSQYEEFNNPLLTTINNIGYFNWLILIIIILIVLFS
jgi:NADH:ubiquinone oxidoreductase subunit 5 (subunit L)/multisubunit Na+/H+ antiporter MnhA subunit